MAGGKNQYSEVFPMSYKVFLMLIFQVSMICHANVMLCVSTFFYFHTEPEPQKGSVNTSCVWGNYENYKLFSIIEVP